MNHKEKRLINQRILGFVLIEMTLGIIVLLRLAYLQIFKFSHYQLLSDKNRLVTERLLPIRGQIMDSSGNVLASNKFSYSAVLDTSELSEEEKNKIITKLKIEEVQENRNKQILLQENLDWETLAKYYVASISIPEITIGKTRTREYSYPQEFSHIIGYTGSPTKYDIDTTGNTALTLPMAKIGKNCIEKMYNEELFGKTGLQVAEVNSRRKFVRIIEHTDSIAGQDIKLTINLDL
ncbi:MAG: hypothetical protein LBF70_01835, partial [Holosporales bacterium]|nr:hypothetical protein [Holosporales bacterium]